MIVTKEMRNILDSVVEYFRRSQEDYLDGETCHYMKNFPVKEFDLVYDYLRGIGEADIREDVTFPEKRRYFVYQSVPLIWRELHGQGTAKQILRVRNYEEWNTKLDWPMEFIHAKSINLG